MTSTHLLILIWTNQKLTMHKKRSIWGRGPYKHDATYHLSTNSRYMNFLTSFCANVMYGSTS